MAQYIDPSELSWSKVWPGVAILLGLTLVSLVTFFGDTVRQATAEGPRLTVLASEVGGLERGSPVWLAGKPSGRVLSLDFRAPGGPPGERIAIEAVLLREAMPFLLADARVTVGASGLLAPSVVKIGPGSPSSNPLSDGDTLRAETRPDLEDFRLLADSVRDAFIASREEFARLRLEIDEGRGAAGHFLADRRFLADMDAARANSERVSEAWRHGGGLPRLMSDDSLRAVVGRAAAVIADLSGTDDVKTVGNSLRAVESSLEQLRESVSEIGTRIETAEGTMGRAVQDSALAVGAYRTRLLLDSLTAELGANPLAWLRLRLF